MHPVSLSLDVIFANKFRDIPSELRIGERIRDPHDITLTDSPVSRIPKGLDCRLVKWAVI